MLDNEWISRTQINNAGKKRDQKNKDSFFIFDVP